MKRLTINVNSWHYKLALYGHLDEEYGRTDLCRYFWALVRGVLKAPLLVSAGVVAGFVLVVGPLMALVVWAISGQLVPDDIAAVGFGAWLIAAIMTSFLCVDELRRRQRYAQQTNPPGLLKSAYRGWKEKTCVLVELAD
jgi:hypothetical protein